MRSASPPGSRPTSPDRARRMAELAADLDLPWGSAVDEAWRAAIDPGRADGRLVAESAEREQEANSVPLPAQLDAGLREALRASGVTELYAHQLEALRASETENVIVTSGTASGKSLAFNMPVLDAIARDPKSSALYLYPTKALAQDQARKLSQIATGGLRLAIYDGDTPREERPAIRRQLEPDPDQPGHAPRRRPAPPPQLGGRLRQPPLRRRRRGPRLPRRLRLPRRQRPAPAAPGRRPVRLRAAVHPHLGDDRQPARARRAPRRDPLPPRRHRRRPEGRPAHRDLEPAADRSRLRRPPLGPLGGRRHAHRPARSPGRARSASSAAAAAPS